MNRAAALALLLPSMALSSLSLASSGCDCTEPGAAKGANWCARPSGACCTDPAKPYHYACSVAVEGPQKAEFQTDVVTVCAIDPNEAHVLASAQAAADFPDGVPRNVACSAEPCPSTLGGS